MSVIGTGTAAAVAQTALQAQQVARRRDREKTDSRGEVKRLRELVETHLRALEEGDEAETTAQLHIDGELPEHQGPSQQLEAVQRRADEVDVAEVAPDDPPVDNTASKSAASGKPPLYRHLDIQA